MARRPAQTEMVFPTWGGKRKGAGRKPNGPVAGVPHLRRPALASRFPVHVTVRMLPHVWNLRSRRSFAVIGRALWLAAEQVDMRICGYSVQGNHIHVIAEAVDQPALARGMKSFGVRIARGLNRVMDRHGQVLADRYHQHILRTPTEARHAVHYVVHNHRNHAAARGETLPTSFIDRYSSASGGIFLPSPHTWLLDEALRR